MDVRENAAQAELLRGLDSFKRVADAIDIWLMLRGGEYVVSRQPCLPGTLVEYDKASQRVAYAGDHAYVIGSAVQQESPIIYQPIDPELITFGTPRKKRWWNR